MKITRQTIKSITPSPVDQWAWDSTVPGFGVRVRPSGTATYVLRYRTTSGTQRKYTIGSADVMSPDEARDRARKLVIDARDGKDPQSDKVTNRHSKSLADLSKAFLEARKPYWKPASYLSYEAAWRNHILPKFGNMKLRDFTADHAEKIMRDLGERKARANMVLQTLATAFNWAVAHHWIDQTPVAKVKGYKQVRRQTILKSAQIKDVLHSLDTMSFDAWSAPYLFKALLFSGLRLTEWSMAEWVWYDADNQTLDIPDTKTGSRTVHVGSTVSDILSDVSQHPRAHKKWIFPNRDGTGPLKWAYKSWCTFRRHMGLDRVRLHDLRHTFATYSLANGASIRDVQHQLGHANIAMTARYLGLMDNGMKSAQASAIELMLAKP